MRPNNMDHKTLTALRGSIAKWEAIVAGTGEDLGYKNCPLCAEFWDDGVCSGCPVSDATGEAGCAGTPYDDYLDHEKGAGLDSLDAHETAVRMRDFLVGLLPAPR